VGVAWKNMLTAFVVRFMKNERNKFLLYSGLVILGNVIESKAWKLFNIASY